MSLDPTRYNSHWITPSSFLDPQFLEPQGIGLATSFFAQSMHIKLDLPKAYFIGKSVVLHILEGPE